VLHSSTVEHPSDVIEWFRHHKGGAVLVSVGMLTEGVEALLRCLMSAQRACAKAVGDVRLEAGSEFGKRGADMIVCGLIDGELVVAAA